MSLCRIWRHHCILAGLGIAECQFPSRTPRMKVKAVVGRPRPCFWPTGDTAHNMKHPIFSRVSSLWGIFWVTHLWKLWVWTRLETHWILFSVTWTYPKHLGDLEKAHIIWTSLLCKQVVDKLQTFEDCSAPESTRNPRASRDPSTTLDSSSFLDLPNS